MTPDEIPHPRRVMRGNLPERKPAMKLTITAFLLSATAAFAGATENVTGCATAQAQGSNFTVRIDPSCALSNDQSDGSGFIVAGIKVAIEQLSDK